MKKNNSISLIDGSGFIFRAYYALPPLTNKKGVPVGAVMGFCNMLFKLLEEESSNKIIVIFDTARKTFRSEIYDNYKANRGDPPEDLIPQFSLIRQAVDAFEISRLELNGFEADDLIATYAKYFTSINWKVSIISSDKDLMQLVNNKVNMLDPLKNKIIVISAGASGIGWATAKVCISRGAKVFLCDGGSYLLGAFIAVSVVNTSIFNPLISYSSLIIF